MLECKTTRKLGYCMVKKCVVCKLLKSSKSYSSALPSFSSSKTIYYLYQQMASFRYAFFFANPTWINVPCQPSSSISEQLFCKYSYRFFSSSKVHLRGFCFTSASTLLFLCVTFVNMYIKALSLIASRLNFFV